MVVIGSKCWDTGEGSEVMRVIGHFVKEGAFMELMLILLWRYSHRSRMCS